MSGCEYYQELISRMLDGDLTAAETAELTEHLDGCPECAALHIAFSELSSAIADDLQEPPESLRENIMAELRREDIRRKNRSVRIKYVRRIAPVAASLAVVLLAAFSAPRLLAGRSETAVYESVMSDEAAYNEKYVSKETAAEEPEASFAADSAESGTVSASPAESAPAPAAEEAAEHAAVSASGSAGTHAAPAVSAGSAPAAQSAGSGTASSSPTKVKTVSPEDGYVYADTVYVRIDEKFDVDIKSAEPEKTAVDAAAANAKSAAAESSSPALFTARSKMTAAPKMSVSAAKAPNSSAAAAPEPIRVDMTERGSWNELKAFLGGEPCEFSESETNLEKYCIELTVDGQHREVYVFIKENNVFYRADVPGGDGLVRKAICSADDFLSFIEQKN